MALQISMQQYPWQRKLMLEILKLLPYVSENQITHKWHSHPESQLFSPKSQLYFTTHSILIWLLPLPFMACGAPSFLSSDPRGRGADMLCRGWVLQSMPWVSNLSRMHLAESQLFQSSPPAIGCLSSDLWALLSTHSFPPLLSPLPGSLMGSTYPVCSMVSLENLTLLPVSQVLRCYGI